MSFAPTDEQQAIISAFATGESMVVTAGAGTGKTSTLRLLADSTEGKGLYLAYNKAIQLEADGTFPSNCSCRTAHSLAYPILFKTGLKDRLNQPRLPGRTTARILGIPTNGFQHNDTVLADWVLASLVMEGVKKFCFSADREPNAYHVPKVDGLDEEANEQFKTFLAPFIRKAWADLTNKSGKLPWNKTHDIYLKLWALTNPVLRFDFILFDEAQDANPVIEQVVRNQKAQVVMVGDQCQAIYAWRGAKDAMAKFPAKHRLTLSQSFRFGPDVAAEANKFLGLLDADLRIKGFDKIASTVTTLGTEVDAILCRTNAQVISEALQAQTSGKKVAIVGGTREIEAFAKAAQSLQANEGTSFPDLAMFKTWGEVQQFVETEATDLKTMVRLIDEYGTEAILAICKQCSNEESADLIVSTAHKSKGREWNRVRIAADFKAPEDGATPSRPELMLCYVSVTRAKLALDCSVLGWVDDVSLAAA